MKTPKRIQLSRRKGFSLQAASRALNGLPAVNCARPGAFGNPYKVTGISDPGNLQAATAAEAVRLFIELRGEDAGYLKWVVPALRGNNLACWCKADADCHCAPLLKWANAPAKPGRKNTS